MSHLNDPSQNKGRGRGTVLHDCIHGKWQPPRPCGAPLHRRGIFEANGVMHNMSTALQTTLIPLLWRSGRRSLTGWCLSPPLESRIGSGLQDCNLYHYRKQYQNRWGNKSCKTSQTMSLRVRMSRNLLDDVVQGERLNGKR